MFEKITSSCSHLRRVQEKVQNICGRHVVYINLEKHSIVPLVAAQDKFLMIVFFCYAMLRKVYIQ
jgi:hypothetical protein